MSARPWTPAAMRLVHDAVNAAGPKASGATLTVTMQVPADGSAFVVTGVILTPVTEPTPPPAPIPCVQCGTSYRACSEGLRGPEPERGHKACCGSCYSTATHRQNAWETFHQGFGLEHLPADPT